MRLVPGVTLVRADEVLHAPENLWQSARGGSGDYFDAVNDSYRQLKQVFAVPDLAAGFRSTAYWHLLAVGQPLRETRHTQDPDVARGWVTSRRAFNNTVNTELDDQLLVLAQARVELERLKVLACRPGLPVVLDTNMLNHWRRPDDVAWPEVLRNWGETVKLARVVVPLRVVDELDGQKYSEGKALRSRATRAIEYLRETLAGGEPGQPAELRNGATLEIWIDTDDRGGDADLAILQCASDLDALHPGTGARVLTGDLGMQLRGEQAGLRVRCLPETYRKVSEPTVSAAATGVLQPGGS